MSPSKVSDKFAATQSSSSSENDSYLIDPNCSNCLNLLESISDHKRYITQLQLKVENYTVTDKVLRENEEAYKAKLEAQLIEIHDYKAKILCQQVAIDSYMTEIALLRKEKTEAKNEVLDYKRKQSNLSAQTMTLDRLVQEGKKNAKSKTGIGYCAVPPPSDFTPMPDLGNDFVPPTSTPASTSQPTNVDVKAETCAKKDKGKNKVADNSTSTTSTGKVSKKTSKSESSTASSPAVHVHSVSDPDKCSQFCTASKPEIRVTTSQPSSEREIVSKVCCYYCKTLGHLVKNCVLLAKQRLKRKELKMRQQSKINGAPSSSTVHSVQPNARKVWRVKNSNVNSSSDVKMQNLQTVDVFVQDVYGRFMPIKAWVYHPT